MVNYQNGKIYKIVSKNTDKIYIGSTARPRLSERMTEHRSDYAYCLQHPEARRCKSFDMLALGDCKIILLESYPCDSKDQLRAREQYYLDIHQKSAINAVKSFVCKTSDITVKHKDNEKEYKRQIYENNKEELKKHYSKYYEDHKEECKARSRKIWHCDRCGRDLSGNKSRHLKLHKEKDAKEEQKPVKLAKK